MHLSGVTDQDAKIAGEAHEAGKGVIIVINKWDEVEKHTGTLENYTKDVYNKLRIFNICTNNIYISKNWAKSW